MRQRLDLTLPSRRSCNPYQEYGHLHSDQAAPENNRWIPYDPTCSPPELMKALRSTIQPSMADKPLALPLPTPRPALNQSLPLPWLRGKTVVLFGDHVERLHNKDFCRFAGGRFASISAEHPLSPPRFVNGIDEKLQGANQPNFDGSRPSVCYIEEYDFVLVSVFHFVSSCAGLDPFRSLSSTWSVGIGDSTRV